MKKLFSLAAIMLLFVALFSCKNQSSSNKNEVISSNSGLRGTWVSEDDSKSEVKINATDWVDVYEGKVLSSNKYYLGDTCLAKPSANANDSINVAGKYITVFEGQDVFCYYIVKLESYSLELCYVGRGNTLKFKRKI